VYIKKIIQYVFLFIAFSALKAAEEKHNQMVVTSSDDNNYCLHRDDFLRFNENVPFIYLALNYMSDQQNDSLLVRDVTNSIKSHIVEIWKNQVGRLSEDHKDLALLTHSQCTRAFSVLSSMSSNDDKGVVYTKLDHKILKNLPLGLIQFLQNKQFQTLCVKLPWYVPSAKESKMIRIAGLIGSFAAPIISWAGVLFASNNYFMPTMDHVCGLCASAGIGCFAGSGLLYAYVIAGRETTKYKKIKIADLLSNRLSE
jgi:hypothetical protein